MDRPIFRGDAINPEWLEGNLADYRDQAARPWAEGARLLALDAGAPMAGLQPAFEVSIRRPPSPRPGSGAGRAFVAARHPAHAALAYLWQWSGSWAGVLRVDALRGPLSAVVSRWDGAERPPRDVEASFLAPFERSWPSPDEAEPGLVRLALVGGVGGAGGWDSPPHEYGFPVPPGGASAEALLALLAGDPEEHRVS